MLEISKINNLASTLGMWRKNDLSLKQVEKK